MVKTVKICFKAPDRRAGQMVELDEAGARRAIEAGEAEEATDEEWTAYHRMAGDTERQAPAKKTGKRGK
jgi:hypothetical protein